MRIDFLIAGLLVGLAGTAWAHVGERVIPISELTEVDVAKIDIHDGTVDDWMEVLGEPVLTPADFQSVYRFGVFYDPSDVDFRLWLGWSSATNRIYVAMERVDDVYINDFAWGTVSGMTFSNHDSGIVLEVDGDHSGGVYYPDRDCCETEKEWIDVTNQQAQDYEGIAELPEGPRVNLGGPHGLGWFLKSPFADGDGKVFGEAPTISITEFYITPFDFLDKNGQEGSHPSELAAGKIIGLRIVINDFDEGDRLADNRFTPNPEGGFVLPSFIGAGRKHIVEIFPQAHRRDSNV